MAITESPRRHPPHALPEPEARSDRLDSERIKVVFVLDNMRIGGTELNAVRTAERLNHARFDLRAVCLGTIEGPLRGRYEAMGIALETVGLTSLNGPSMIRSGRRFMRILRRERAAIVHAHDIYANIFAAAWARRGGAQVLITSRRWGLSQRNWKLAWGNRVAAMRSSAVLANSAAVAKLVTAEVASAEGKVWTINNFVDEYAFGAPDPTERDRLRGQWNVPPGAVVIGCVARLHPVKDHASLLRAFAMLRAHESRVHLVLIGDGELRPTLESLAQELGIGDSVYFAGEQRAHANFHRGFDVSVLSSVSEGFPNTVVEAMAAGNPVVATAVGGTVDAVVDEETGLLVPPGHPADLAAALQRVAESAELRTIFGRAGEQRARERFHVSSVVPALETMYDRLLADQAR